MKSRSSRHGTTELLVRLREGKGQVFDDLFERVYPELQERARRQRLRWKGDPSLRTTALAHEVYLKLVDQEERSWETRSHFLAVAAKAMRHILIDHVRRETAEKRGGGAPVLSLEELKGKLSGDATLAGEEAQAFVLLDEALEQLQAKHPRAANGVECRFFGGMTIEETAEALDVSTATVSRDWRQAKAWLYRKMKRVQGDSDGSDEETVNKGRER